MLGVLPLRSPAVYFLISMTRFQNGAEKTRHCRIVLAKHKFPLLTSPRGEICGHLDCSSTPSRSSTKVFLA